jgi:hypothetical protein
VGEPTILVMLTDLSQDNRAAYDRSNGEDRAMSILGELAAVELEKATAALRTLWGRLKAETRVPLRSDFTPELLKPWLPNIVIVEAVGAPPRFRVRLAGTAAVSFAGRDFTDRFLDEVIPPEHYQATIAPYLHAIENGEPAEDDILRHQFVAPDGTSLPVRRLVMPCSSDGHAIDRFVVGLFLYRPQSF